MQCSPDQRTEDTEKGMDDIKVVINGSAQQAPLLQAVNSPVSGT